MCVMLIGPQPAAASYYADFVEGYVWGNGADGYDNPAVALGRPERITGEGTWPAQVEPFNGPWLTSEIVSIGPTGHLSLGFNDPVLNERGDGYDADFIVFGNAFFASDAPNWWDPPLLGATPTISGEPGKIEVSQDAAAWYEIPGVFADDEWPTLGYTDGTAGSGTPGDVPSNFREPMDPALTLADFANKTWQQVFALYGTSGGGAACDIADAVDGNGDPAGLDSISYVRITVPDAGTWSTEIDGVSVVPEPTTLGLLMGGAALALYRRRHR